MSKRADGRQDGETVRYDRRAAAAETPEQLKLAAAFLFSSLSVFQLGWEKGRVQKKLGTI